MITVQSNRRQNRSADVLKAIELQLLASRDRAKFSAIVLADDLGLVMASAGNPNVGEQLAAISPMLAPDMKVWRGTVRTGKGQVRMTIAPIRVDDSLMFLSATEGTGQAITRELFMSGRGVSRILA